jgi:hypothetical protein
MSSVVASMFRRFIDSMTRDTAPPRNQHASQSARDFGQSPPQIGWTEESRQEITERVAEDHARLLAMVGTCLAEIDIRASVTTFHNLALYAETFVPSSRYEPELDVFWPGEDRDGIALRVKLIDQGGQHFYAWGVSWAHTHLASDPAGAARVIADAVLAV